MIVVRLECSDGDGIFRIRKEGFDLLSFPAGKRICHLHDTFPDPYQEFGNEFTENHYCAYPSFTNFIAWISLEDLHELIIHDVDIYLMNVKSSLVGQQVCYLKKDIIWKKKINELF
jgi:hypothetical protein